MPVLIVAEHDRGQLSPAVARLVAAAGAFSGPIDLLVAGDDITGVASEAAAIAGVGRVRLAEARALKVLGAETLVPLLASLVPEYGTLIAAASALGRDTIPRLAAKCDTAPVTDVTAILAPQTFERPIYAGNAIETVTSPQPHNLLTLRASAFEAAGQGGSAPIETLTVPELAPLTRFIADLRSEGDRPDLSTAPIVVGGGVAVGSAAGFKLIEQLATRLGAAVGATRAAVDAGYAPNDVQVGQTGKIIAPDLYIAIGISGALQHLAGIGGAKKIVAINIDPEAPLFKLADLALKGDLFTVIPDLIAQLDRLGA